MEDKYMKTPKGTLSPRQEELMLFLWDKDVPQIIASVIGTEKDSVEKEIDEMLQRLQ